MRIGIILHPYGEDKPAGLGRAIFEITRSLIELDKKNEYLIILRKRPRTLPQFPGSNWKLKIVNWKFFWLDRALWGENLDVCIFNTPIVSFFIRPKKSVVIAYDFAYDDFGPNRFLKWYHGFSLKAADLIISISEATKKEVMKRFKINTAKIRVVYLGHDDICRNSPSPLPNLPSKFFLFVGAIKERKNVFGIVKAFHEAKKKSDFNYKLVISGQSRGPYYEKITRYISENSLEQEIMFLGHTTDGELASLYKKAEALVYPSFIEGFGLPLLEAMGCGLAVITSNVSSLPEVAGDAALLVDPADIAEISRAMQRIAFEKGLREKLVEQGHSQVKKFSWKKTGENVLTLI